MLTAQANCQILSVGEIKEQKGFKKCFVRVRTKELRDDVSNDVIRQSGIFEAEVAIKDDGVYHSLLAAALLDPVPLTPGLPPPPRELLSLPFVPCYFILRSFFYTEKNVEKLGKQLQLKRWWR